MTPRSISGHVDPAVDFREGSFGIVDQKGQHCPIPTSPVIIAALRAIYAGGSKNRWSSDSYGRPRYCYESRHGKITFFFPPIPDYRDKYHIAIALYYIPRLAFVYSGRQRASVKNLSVETADIFLILMARIAKLRDPARDIASISLEEIADYRGVHIRHGSARNLYEDFKAEVMRLSDMCMTTTWRDYTRGGTITFGKESPDRLLDIVDVEYKDSRETWTSFRYRCGQALSHFLSPGGLRWIGYYSRSLLQLSPYHEAFTKKLGTYWTMVGIIAGKKGLMPRATPYTILDFCGEEINWRNPGQTVDAFIKAHDRLVDIGVLTEMSILDPLSRTKGYFKDWLETPISVKLSEGLWHIRMRKETSSRRKLVTRQEKEKQSVHSFTVPHDAQALIHDSSLIRRFRTDCFFLQAELARALGIKRQTLSKYERGINPLPEDKAIKILQIWHEKTEYQ
jgi:DNA-binding XRE family transcriptional regulator